MSGYGRHCTRSGIPSREASRPHKGEQGDLGILQERATALADKLSLRVDVCLFVLNSYRPHRSIALEYESKCHGRLHFMFLPPYSPELNPQENVWAWLKDYSARDSAYTADKELAQRIRKFFIYAYNTPRKMRMRMDARVHFGTA